MQGRKIFVRIFIVFFLITTIFIVYFYTLLQSATTKSVSKAFEVKEGDSTAVIASKLQQKGLIKSAFAFRVYKQISGSILVPGVYVIDSSENVSSILNTIAKGKSSVIKVTLLEGWRAKDIEEYMVNEKGLSQFIGFTKKAEKYEGYLYPDTYEILLIITPDEFIKLLRDTFVTKTKSLNPTSDQVILASIIEREAASDSERADIAGVYTNRLKIGMRLEADPTIQYAKGNWQAVTLAEYRSVISPYNTYLNDGLPPTPIANPSVKSIEAAINPAKHNYYFFFHANGNIYFSKTLSEHKEKLKSL
ncbi:endolytic transglycosylase MltG [Candidatus Berkelbacteria bacterium]|nr:endolytic transglycosylase MltG [Candidatus Berkelbacteria bacterium]